MYPLSKVWCRHHIYDIKLPRYIIFLKAPLPRDIHFFPRKVGRLLYYIDTCGHTKSKRPLLGGRFAQA